jgi:hypothetical protein
MKPWTRAIMHCAACGLMFGVVALVGGRLWWPHVAAAQARQSAVADVVRARRLEVVDVAGEIRAVPYVDPEGGSGLDLRDPSGQVRASLNLTPGGRPGLVLNWATGKFGALLLLGPGGAPGLDLSDAAGNTRAALSLAADGSSGLVLMDGAGKPRADLRMQAGGSPKGGVLCMRSIASRGPTWSAWPVTVITAAIQVPKDCVPSPCGLHCRVLTRRPCALRTRSASWLQLRQTRNRLRLSLLASRPSRWCTWRTSPSSLCGNAPRWQKGSPGAMHFAAR